MPCYKPIKGFRTPHGVVFQELARHDILGDISLACGQCIGCRWQRAAEWQTRCMHEASMWPSNCFVTLTYGRDQMPADGSLDHRDFQLFFKRLRKYFRGRTIRYYMCGEYGPLHQRPHYHANLFNVDFRSDQVEAGTSASGEIFYTSPTLSKLWGLGRVSVQELTPQTAGYTARYITKKQLGPGRQAAYVTPDGVIRREEYAAMSRRPGIGSTWLQKYQSDVYPHDFVIVDGSKQKVPSFYDRLLRKQGNEALDQIEYEREMRARSRAADTTDARLAAREQVHKARVKSFTRNDL